MARRKRKLQVYSRWKDVPRTLATRNIWRMRSRKVRAKTEPAALFEGIEERKLTVIDYTAKIVKTIHLYHEDQTTPVVLTPLERAKHLFFRAFVKPANRKRLIKRCKGASSGARSWPLSLTRQASGIGMPRLMRKTGAGSTSH